MQFAPSLAGLIARAVSSVLLISMLVAWLQFQASPQPTKNEISLVVFVAGCIQPTLFGILELVIYFRKCQSCNVRLREFAGSFQRRPDEDIPYSTIFELLREKKMLWQFGNIFSDTTPIDRAIDMIEAAKLKPYRRYSDLFPTSANDICAILDTLLRDKRITDHVS